MIVFILLSDSLNQEDSFPLAPLIEGAFLCLYPTSNFSPSVTGMQLLHYCNWGDYIGNIKRT